MRTLLFTTLLLVSMCAHSARAADDGTPLDVSIVQLIATPEKFDGKIVRIVGFMCIAFEGDAIYLHREDFEQSLVRNALWVNLPEDRDESLSQKYVILEGTFDATDHGRMGLFSGAIKKVTRMDEWNVR